MDSELDQLLHDRFGIGCEDFVIALRSLPWVRPWATALTEAGAQLLDDADFGDDRQGYVATGIETAGHAGRLAVSALTTDAVQTALGLSGSQIRQKRFARELWAISDGKNWLFPISQFDTDPTTGLPFRQVRGLPEVFKTLAEHLHPVAIDGFLHTPQPELARDGHAQTPLDWLRGGGDVLNVLAAVAASDWYGR